MNQEKASNNSEDSFLKKRLLLNLFALVKLNTYLKDMGITSTYEYFTRFCVHGEYSEAVTGIVQIIA